MSYPSLPSYTTYPATGPPSVPAGLDGEGPLRDLYLVLEQHKDWLKTNYADDRGWQDFLAKHQPPETRDMPEAVIDHDQAETVKQCLPAVMKLFAASDAEARRQAAHLLWKLADAAVPAVPALAALANDADQQVREATLAILASLGPAAKEAAPHLVTLIRAGDARCHPVELARVLLFIDPQADVIPDLVRSLGDEQPKMRVVALGVLSSLDAARVAEVRREVAARIADENREVRLAAIAASSRLVDRNDAIALFEAALASEADRGLKRYLARTILRLKNGPLENSPK